MAARPVLPFTFLAPCVQETFRTFFFPVPRFLSMSFGQRHLDSGVTWTARAAPVLRGAGRSGGSYPLRPLWKTDLP